MTLFINQHEEDICIARNIFCSLYDNSDFIVFVHEPEFRTFYAFGSVAFRLNQIISRLGLEKLYPSLPIKNELYYDIPDDKFYYLLYNLINDDQKIQIV